MRKIIKTFAIGILIALFLLVIDLYIFNFFASDPGYYVVARRSDTPDQVIDALNQIDLKEIPTEKLIILRERYKTKKSASDFSVEEKFKWRAAYTHLTNIIEQNRNPNADTAP